VSNTLHQYVDIESIDLIDVDIDRQTNASTIHCIYRVYKHSTAKLQEWIPHIERQKKGITAWAWRCMVTELSERVFTECMLARPDCRNKL
jgi:hypothetical protein